MFSAETEDKEKRRGNLKEARGFLEISLQAVNKIPAAALQGNKKGEREAMKGRAHHNLAQVNHQLGDREAFLSHLEKAESVLSSVKLVEDLYNLYDGMTVLLLQTG